MQVFLYLHNALFEQSPDGRQVAVLDVGPRKISAVFTDQEAKKVKISEEEVGRLLAFSSYSRRIATPSVSKVSTHSIQSREAAQTDVSTTAKDILKVKKQLSQLSDVRQDRVQALKEQIDNGTYHVSGEDIADLIIRRTLADSTAL